MVIDEGIDIKIQPIFNIANLRIEYGEVLLRPKDEKVSTFDILKEANKNNKTLQLDKQIIIKACEAIKKSNSKIKLSVNLCANTMKIKDVYKEIYSLIDGYKIDRYRIIIEINEDTEFMSDVVMNNIDGLIKNGILIAIDDFGCGNTSLSNIIDYKLDAVKFDKSLISIDGYQKRHLKGLVSILNELMIDTVIEGVETTEDLEKIKEIGYKLMQGYLPCKPLSVDEFIRMTSNYTL